MTGRLHDKTNASTIRHLHPPFDLPGVGPLKRGRIPSICGLTSFVAAAQHGSFTRAAAELNLSQGAVSRQIRELEGYLGIRLFDRVRQRALLTEAGQHYLSQIEKPLGDLEIATRKAEAFSDGTVVSIAVVPGFATRWLLPRLPAFQKKNPKIMVHVTSRQRPVDFAREPFDAALVFDPPLWPGTTAYHLMDSDMVAVCGPKLNENRVIKRPADILKFPLLHKMSRPNRWAEWLAGAGVILDDRPLKGVSYPQITALAEAAVAGLGVALLPRNLFAEELADRRLQIVANESLDSKISYYLMVSETRARSDAVQTFAQWLIAEARTRPTSADAQAAR